MSPKSPSRSEPRGLESYAIDGVRANRAWGQHAGADATPHGVAICAHAVGDAVPVL